MLDEKAAVILIIDDEPVNIKLLSGLLRDKYAIMAVNSGKKAVEMIKRGNVPDLILLDIIMPEMSGYDVCERLQKDESTKDIPVIFISGMNQDEDEERGLKMGAVDYITKPFVPAVVLARVDTHIKLSKALKELKMLYRLALESNPLTGLPGNNAIMREIEKSLEEKNGVCVMYLDLDNFKAYNDKYGFAMGDRVIMFTVSLMKKLTRNISDPFLAHIGGDDFVVILPSYSYVEFAENFIAEFDEGIKSYYTPEDIETGKIISINRKGEIQEFPIITVSIACVDLENTGYSIYLEVNDACTALKKHAKNTEGSCYLVDRRKN